MRIINIMIKIVIHIILYIPVIEDVLVNKCVFYNDKATMTTTLYDMYVYLWSVEERERRGLFSPRNKKVTAATAAIRIYLDIPGS